MDIESTITVSPKEAIEFVETVLRARRVPFLRGSPGIGKTDIAHTVAENYNLQLIDMRLSQCDPTDLNGFPTIINGKAHYIPMSVFPLESDPLPPGKDGWLIMFDELPSALPATISISVSSSASNPLLATSRGWICKISWPVFNFSFSVGTETAELE